MKYFLLVNFICLSIAGRANDTLQFFQGTFSEVLEESAKLEKPILLYFHFTGCGACAEMERNVLANSSVIDYYNEAYLLFDVNIRVGEGPEIKKQHKVRFSPSFIFLNPEGEEAHKLVGIFSVDEFIHAGKVVIEEDKSLKSFYTRYEEGERNSEFLYEFCQAQQDAAATDSTVIYEYIASLPEDELNTEKTISFIYEFSFVDREPVFGFDSPAIEALRNNKDLIINQYDSSDVENRILYTAIYDFHSAIKNKDEDKYDRILSYIEAHLPEVPYIVYPEIDGRHTMAIGTEGLIEEYQFLKVIKFNGPEAALTYLAKTVPNPDSTSVAVLYNYAGVIYNNTDNTALLNLSLEYSERILRVKESYETYSTYAFLLFKLERYTEAKVAVLKAIELGEKDRWNCENEIELLRKVEMAIDEG